MEVPDFNTTVDKGAIEACYTLMMPTAWKVSKYEVISGTYQK